MAITEKRVDINNPSAYKMPMVRKSDEEIEDSFMKEAEPSSATPSLPEKIVSSEKTINYESNKPKIVTKEQMQKAGFDNLRDYLNATNAGGPLKRRTNKYEDQGLDASGKGSAPLRNIPQLPNNGTNKMGTKDASLKMVKLAKGGMTRSSASKRADGIATKGFTKGRNL